MRHGFKRFLILNAHGGNAAITRFIVDRINQETEGIAVDLGSVLGPFRQRKDDYRQDAIASRRTNQRHDLF